MGKSLTIMKTTGKSNFAYKIRQSSQKSRTLISENPKNKVIPLNKAQ